MNNKTINTVGDCDEIIKGLFDEHEKISNKEDAFLYRCMERDFLLGVWFRGEPHTLDTQLEPGIFRPRPSKGTLPKSYFEEKFIFNYTRNRVPQFSNGQNDLFTTLSRMQHYGAPTRLLDWSESMLVALYFAVRDVDENRDANLFCLNARRLNKKSSMRESWDNIHDDTSFGTKFRTAFVFSDTRKNWFHSIAEHKDFRWTDVDKYKSEEGVSAGTDVPLQALADHCMPVAVIPSFITTRHQVQRTVFTLHGGKHYDSNDRTGVLNDDERLPSPVSLVKLNDKDPENRRFLLRFKIPGSSKELIRKQLHIYGIHEGTLFPDSDMLGLYIKEMFQ